jgi:hypothetical protein
MSNKTQLQTNNARLDTLIETLKGKAVGGGGGEVNMGTCTVNITPPSSSNYYTGRETVSNGAISYTVSRSYTGSKFSVEARCDSVMYISASTIKSATATDGEILNVVSGYGIAFKTPSGNGTTVTITLGA